MHEPIKDLWAVVGLPGAILQDTQVLGEVHGRLFSIDEELDYQQRGGAKYARGYKIANRNIVMDMVDEDIRAASGDSSCVHEEDATDNANSSSWWPRRSARRSCPATPPPCSSSHNRREGCASSSTLLGSWWQRSLDAVGKLQRFSAFFLPFLRLGFPSAVPCTARRPHRHIGGNGPERVTAIAFHPVHPLLAVSVEEGGSHGQTRVLIMDVVTVSESEPARLSCVLTHAFQKRVEVLAWKPHSDDVLAVGCESGVLLWSLEAGSKHHAGNVFHEEEIICGHPKGDAVQPVGAPSTFNSFPSQHHKQERRLTSKDARCLFYSYCGTSLPVTTMSFSPLTGRFLACGSRFYTSLSLLDVSVPPCVAPNGGAVTLTTTTEGGTEKVYFADEDRYLLSLTCGHPSIYVTLLSLLKGSATQEATRSIRIGTPFPVLDAHPASGVGPDHYFLNVSRIEGLVLARVDLKDKSLSVVATISTSVDRGIGGLVRCYTCSKRRLWIVTETGHMLVCGYHRVPGKDKTGMRFALTAIGGATLDASSLVGFDGFSSGSLVAVVEQQEVLHLVPSYHA